MTTPVVVNGLKELTAALRHADKESMKTLRALFLKESQTVLKDMDRTARRYPTATQKLVKDGAVKTRVTAKDFRIVVDGRAKRTRWALGAEFGSKRFRRFLPHKPDGYVVYPTVKAKHEQLSEAVASALENIVIRYPDGRVI